jgi:hypothetical protein
MKRRAENYEILYDLPEGEYSDAGVGGIRTRTIRAGEVIDVEAYPITKLSGEARREARKRASSPAQDRLNRERAKKRVFRLLEENFGEGDYHLTLTWDYGFVEHGMVNMDDVRRDFERLGVPWDDEEAKRAFANFGRRVKRAMKRRGEEPGEFKYLYVIESTHGPRDGDRHPLPPRYHIHVVIRAPGLSRDELEAMWGHGHANADHLSMQYNGLEALAAYLTKQTRLEVWQGGRRTARRWGHSQNLREPVERVSDRKISRRRAARIAGDVMQWGREIFEKLYPGYRCVETPVVKYSDFVAGAYIYARLRRRRNE